MCEFEIVRSLISKSFNFNYRHQAEDFLNHTDSVVHLKL